MDLHVLYHKNFLDRAKQWYSLPSFSPPTDVVEDGWQKSTQHITAPLLLPCV